MSISTTRTNTIGTFRDESNGTFRIFTGISYTRGEEVQRDEEGHIIIRDELQLLVPEMLYPLLHSGGGIDEIENTTIDTTIDGEHLRIFQGGDRLNPIEIITNETLPVEAPEIITNETLPVEAHEIIDSTGIDLLIDIVSKSEQDPTERSKFMRILRQRLGGRTHGILEEMSSITKKQLNPFDDVLIGTREVFTFQAMPQSCKTALLLFAAWVAGIRNKMPTVLLTLNRCAEYERFNSQVPKFNSFVQECAYVMGYTGDIPLLSIYNGDEKLKMTADIRTMNSGVPLVTPYKIPIAVFMTNPKKITNTRDMLKTLSCETGFDHTDDHTVLDGKSMNALLILDEAELTIKTDDQSSRLEQEMEKSVDMMRNSDDVVGVTGNSMIDSFTTRINISATQHAFALSNRPDLRTRKFIQAIPSTNYSSLTYGSKQVVRKECISHHAMVEDMLERDVHEDYRCDRQGLVMDSQRTYKTSSQQKEALECMKKLVGLPKDLKKGLFSCTWESVGISVYTYCTDTQGILSNANTFKRSPVPGFTDLYKYTSLPCTTDIVNDALIVSAERTYINSYPGLMGYIDSCYEKNDDGERVSIDSMLPGFPLVYKTILFAFSMTGRSIPVKAFTHAFPLTDMYGDFSDASNRCESLIQAFGRICGVDTSTQTRTLWASKAQFEKLSSSISRLPFYNGVIQDNTSMEKKIREFRRIVDSTPDGGSVIDSEHAHMCEHIFTSRPGVCVGVKRERKAVEEVLSRKKVKVNDVAIPVDDTWTQLPIILLPEDKKDAGDVPIAGAMGEYVAATPGQLENLATYMEYPIENGGNTRKQLLILVLKKAGTFGCYLSTREMRNISPLIYESSKKGRHADELNSLTSGENPSVRSSGHGKWRWIGS